MNHGMDKIAIIIPHKNLYDTTQKVLKDNNLDIKLYQGDLSEGVDVAKQALEQGYEVLVSRGGTYLMIKEAFPNVPVIDIQVTGYDLIRSLKEVKHIGKIALCGYKNIFYGAKDITELFGLKVSQFVIEKDLAKIMDELMEERDTDLVVGDTAGVRLAKSLGFDTYLIESGEESIFAALREAQRVAQIRYYEKRRAEELKIILNNVDNGIISVNSEGIITVLNKAAEEKIGVTSEVIGKHVKDAVENTRLNEVLKSGKAEIGQLQKIQDRNIVTNRIPIIINNKIAGAVATLQDVSNLQKIERQIRRKLHEKGLYAKYTFSDIKGESQEIKSAILEAKKYAKVDSTILINAETGTGKELFAQSIHNESNRKSGPFVAINCGALPLNLLESELFGYAEGAFTGARKEGKPGIFELAHGGTLFLDEIGEITPDVQVQLLRVLQERVVRRIGDDRIIPVDVRIIAATNKDLSAMITNNNFRADLYYRLDVLRISIPPLRERSGDIPLLFKNFANRFNWTGDILSQQSKGILIDHTWPGNIRELENLVEKLYLLTDGGVVTTDILYRSLTKTKKEHPALHKNETIGEMEKHKIIEILKETGFDKNKAAEKLGISRTTLWRKLKKFHIET